jgi:hypothetical protein
MRQPVWSKYSFSKISSKFQEEGLRLALSIPGLACDTVTLLECQQSDSLHHVLCKNGAVIQCIIKHDY